VNMWSAGKGTSSSPVPRPTTKRRRPNRDDERNKIGRRRDRGLRAQGSRKQTESLGTLSRCSLVARAGHALQWW